MIHQAICASIHAMLTNETQERKEGIWNAVLGGCKCSASEVKT
jgi:hypothetical protein